MKLSFSLKSSNPKLATPSTPVLKKPIAFASLEDDERKDAPFPLSSSSKQLIPQNVGPSKATRKRLEAERQMDQSMFEYDEHWDKIQETRERQKEAKELDAQARKPKYISSLLDSAATRKLDYLRAEEKMIAREREAEGNEFADKDAFVTQAYKDQQIEVRRAEAEEKARDEAAKKKNAAGVGNGLAHFYRKLLDESEAKHEEAVTATTKPKIGPQGPMPNLTITRPPEARQKTDLELARAAMQEGKEVELNDDNQIVDKRDLLSGGLNLSLPNTRKLGLQKTGNAKASTSALVNTHRAVGTAATRKEINERRAREIQTQMEQEAERVTRVKAEDAAEAQRRLVAKRNTESDLNDAKERYLARKRQKLEPPPAGEEAINLESTTPTIA